MTASIDPVELQAGQPQCSPRLSKLVAKLNAARAERDRLEAIHEPLGGKDDAAGEAAREIVGDIEGEIIDIEPSSIADLKQQIALALHQQLVDGGWNDDFPVLIMHRTLRLMAWENR